MFAGLIDLYYLINYLFFYCIYKRCHKKNYLNKLYNYKQRLKN